MEKSYLEVCQASAAGGQPWREGRASWEAWREGRPAPGACSGDPGCCHGDHHSGDYELPEVSLEALEVGGWVGECLAEQQRAFQGGAVGGASGVSLLPACLGTTLVQLCSFDK